MNHHAECDVFGLNGTKTMAKVFGDVMRPGAHQYVFCSALQFAIWYRALLWKKKKSKQASGTFPAKAGVRTRIPTV